MLLEEKKMTLQSSSTPAKTRRFRGYKHSLKHPGKEVKIFILCCIYIFKASLSKLLSFYFLKKNTYLNI
jgi:hypothetical protein